MKLFDETMKIIILFLFFPFVLAGVLFMSTVAFFLVWYDMLFDKYDETKSFAQAFADEYVRITQ